MWARLEEAGKPGADVRRDIGVHIITKIKNEQSQHRKVVAVIGYSKSEDIHRLLVSESQMYLAPSLSMLAQRPNVLRFRLRRQPLDPAKIAVKLERQWGGPC